MAPLSDADFFARIREILRQGSFDLPDNLGYRGTGGPGRLLEELLGFELNNRDGPDSGVWELKFHSGSTPLTLFHKTPEPKGIMQSVVRNCGWPGTKEGIISFRHTIWGRSPRGFNVVNEGSRITVRNEDYPDLIAPYWTHDTLMTAFAYKLRRLVLVRGKRSKKNGTVTYQAASLWTNPRLTELMNLIESGVIAVDFDARTKLNTDALRDHGTKFRISLSNLGKLYANQEVLNQ